MASEIFLIRIRSVKPNSLNSIHMKQDKHLIQIKDLSTYFHTINGKAAAVKNTNIYLDQGEVLGLVGESGSGKSITALSIMRLLKPPLAKIEGQILFNGNDLLQMSKAEMRNIRGGRISMIFQEPMTSLNPVYTVGDQIAEMFKIHENSSKNEALNKTVEMLRQVQIPSPEKRVGEYPHQLSGGMRQRVMIAMAMACNPEILIADEPTTALDVTIQAQIIDLMIQLTENYKTAILMITHDLGVISEIAQRVAVMYSGSIVEEAKTEDIFNNPLHPYTHGLLRSIPRIGLRAKIGRQRLHEITGIVPSIFDRPAGCSFHPRCSQAQSICREKSPELVDLGNGHRVSCWFCTE